MTLTDLTVSLIMFQTMSEVTLTLRLSLQQTSQSIKKLLAVGFPGLSNQPGATLRLSALFISVEY